MIILRNSQIGVYCFILSIYIRNTLKLIEFVPRAQCPLRKKIANTLTWISFIGFVLQIFFQFVFGTWFMIWLAFDLKGLN